MTVGVAYRVPGLGAVVGCDSRTLVGDDEILTDQDEKWLIAGSAVACCAGELGGLWFDLRAAPPRNWPELRRACITFGGTRHADVLVYDRRTDAIWHTDDSGEAVRRGHYAAIGAGGLTALGALDASPAPKTLEAAERLVRRAIKIAYRRHSSCGGRVRILVVHGKRGVISVR